MARAEEAKVAKKMKEAKTAEEMVMSWFAQRPGWEGPSGRDPLDLYIKRKPEMVFTYAHNQLAQVVDRGILDPKTRYLAILGMYMMLNHWEGILPQCCNAKAAGATEEEIMEIAFLACYAVGKDKMAGTAIALLNAFENPAFSNTKTMTD